MLKSSEIGENAFTKRFLSVIQLKSSDLDETTSMAVFKVVEFTSVVKTDVGSFLGDLGIIFAQRLVCCMGSVTLPLCFSSNFSKG